MHITKNLKRIALLLIILACTTIPVVIAPACSLIIGCQGTIYYLAGGFPFKDGFESGDFGFWMGIKTEAGGIATVQQLNPYEGNYHACFTTNGKTSGKEWAASYYDIPTEKNEIYARGYFYIANGLPLDDEKDRFGLITVYSKTGQLQAILRIAKVSGVEKYEVQTVNGDSYSAVATDSIYPQEHEWVCIELYFKVHPTEGEVRVWINGIERMNITGKDTNYYGNIGQVCYGLVSINLQHTMNLYVDAAVISNDYVGQLYNFAVIANAQGANKYMSALDNLYLMLSNLNIQYKMLLPSELIDETVLKDVDGVISFVSTTGLLGNASAVKEFARTHVVITHAYDFANFYYPSFSSSYALVRDVVAVKYLVNWGTFRTNDRPEMRRIDDSLGVILADSMSSYANITKIAQYDDSRIAFFRMSGETENTGFYVMDFYATRNSTLRANNWHLFPAINYVRGIAVGEYARWLAQELYLNNVYAGWYSLDWVNSFMQNLTSKNPELVQLHTFGKTVQGRNMYALLIGKGSRYILVDAAMHGDEQTGTFAALRSAELLVEYYNAGNTYWKSRLADYKIIIVPVSNPDGYYADTRTNSNGKDLNRNYPPDGDTQFTEPESRAFANLLGNYTPTIFINLHTYLNQMLFYEDINNRLTEPFKTFALRTWHMANTTYTTLKHWGEEEEWYDGGWPKFLGKINWIGSTGTELNGAVFEYAWWKHKTISVTVEFYHASPAFNLLGQEYFCSVIFTAIQHYDQLADIQAYSTGKILSTSYAANNYKMYLHTEELQAESQSEIYVGSRGKPITVVIDDVQKNEGNGWSWSESSNVISLTSVKSSVSLNWTA